MIQSEKKSTENFYIDNSIKLDEKNGVMANGFSRTEIMDMTTQGNHLTNFTLEMDYYEIIARPRMIKNINNLQFDKSQVERIIKEIFQCPICMTILIDPVNIKTCLHKFCKKCIEDYNRRV
jgi:hypothetical protein